MSADGVIGVAVVGEDEVHRALAMGLFDGALYALASHREAPWLDPAHHHRRWLVYDSGERQRRGYLDSHREVALVAPGGRPIRVHGFIDGRPAGPAAHKLYNLYLHHKAQSEPPDVVLVLIDTDGDERIMESAAQVCAEARRHASRPLLVIGTPHRDAESWLFAAPIAADAETRKRHESATRILSFDPCKAPERLTASPNDKVTDAKRVLRYVLLHDGDDLQTGRPRSAPPSPEEADQLAAALAAQLDRAAGYEACGLASFIEALRAVVEDVFADHVAPAVLR